MRLEIKENAKKEYYDEFLYIVFRHRKIRRCPRKKACQLSKYLMCYNIICIISIILFVLFYIDTKRPIFLFLDGMLTIIFMFLVVYYMIVKKRLEMYLQNKGVKTIEFNEVGIEYIDDDKNIRIKWEDIKHIIINKYTITIIPKTILNGFTSIDVKYKDEVINTLKKYDKEKLLVDNTSFYRKQEEV